MVALGVAVLCALPALASALPVTVPTLTASQLRARILGSANMSYTGYAESNATFGLPPLAGLSSVTSLLDGVTKMRVWQAAPQRWRVDTLTDAGERDTYQLGATGYQWNSGAQLLTMVLPAAPGTATVRLPRAADLLPTSLAQRVLSQVGTSAAAGGPGRSDTARFSTLPPLRVAGQSAAGLQVTPADPASTIGAVDIWAQPSTGLPLMVEVFGRGARTPALQSQFFQVGPWTPAGTVLTPPPRVPGTGFTTASASNLTSALRNLEFERLPGALAGRERVPSQVTNVGLYGSGLALFTVLAVRAGSNFMADAQSDGGTPYSFPHGTGYLLSASLVEAVVARSDRSGDTYLLAGTVSGKVLLEAAAELTSNPQ
jgi:hypothetical protein